MQWLRPQWPKDWEHNGQKTENTMAKRLRTQWPKDWEHNDQKTGNTMTKRLRTQWPKDWEHNGQKTENTMTKRLRTQSPKDWEHNEQKKQEKRKNNDLQSTTQKTKDRATWNSIKSGVNSDLTGRISSSCATYGARRVTVTRHEHYLTWKIA
jgi:hypothetical protein